MILALLFWFAAANDATPPPTPAMQREVRSLFEEWQQGRMGDAHQRLAPELQKKTGPVQLAALFDAVNTTLGGFQSVGALHAIATEPMGAAGDREYDVDVRYAKATTVARFVFAGERIRMFALTVPEKTPVAVDESVVVPIAREMLASAQKEGIGSLVERLEDPGKKAEQERWRSDAERIGKWLGPMLSVDVGKAQPSSVPRCRKLDGQARFEFAPAVVHMELCSDNGFWQLWNATWEPEMKPALVERALASIVGEAGTIACPHDAPFPPGGDIVCTFTAAGKPVQELRVRRTDEDQFKVVGVADRKE